MKKIIKYKPLIIGIFPILIIFLCRWYSNYFSLSFVLGPFIFCVIIIFSYLGTLFLLANSLNEFIKTRNNVYVMTFVLLLFFSILYVFFPFDEEKAKFDFKNNHNKYTEVINKIESGQLENINTDGYVELDEKYKKLSITKNIKVNKINDEFTVCFWFYKGLMIGDGSSMLVYSSDGIKTIADDNYFYDIVYLKEIENNWYFVETKF